MTFLPALRKTTVICLWIQLALFVLSPHALISQSLDSLWAVWNDPMQEDTLRLEAMTSISKQGYLYSDPDSAYELAQIQLEFAQETQQARYEGIALNTQGISLMNRQRTAEALEHFRRSKEIRESLDDKAGVAYSINNIGQVYWQIGEYDSATTRFEQSYAIQKDIGNQKGQAIAMGNLGNIYEAQGKLIQAIQAFTNALKIMESMGNSLGVAGCKINMAHIYLGIGDEAQAQTYFEEGIELAREINHRQFLANGIAGLGNLMHELGSYPEAFKYHLEGYKLHLLVGDRQGEGTALHNLGMVAYSSEQLDTAEYYFLKSLGLRQEMGEKDGEVESLNSLATLYEGEKKYQEAIELSQQALGMAKEIGSLYEMSRANNTLRKSYAALGNTAKAYPYLNRLLSQRDSLTDQDNQREVLRQEYQYSYEKQSLTDSLMFVQEKAETELSYQKQLANRNYLLFGGLGLALLGFLFLRYRTQLRNRQRELELQRERERKEQLAQLDAMKSRFFANISHEFRTPLTLILGQNEQLQSKIDDPALDGNFEMLDRNGRRLLGLINQVLDLSKLESGKLNMQKLPMNLIPFLKNMIFSFESLAEQKKIKLGFEGQSEALIALVDPEKVERVFFNLISNAIKFTPEEGEIQMLVEKEGKTVRIGIRDTGVGISQDQLAYIFDRFYQADSNELSPSPGTGIGLALAKELVELHQGSLSVESEVGQGSIFWVELPLGEERVNSLSTYSPQLEPTEAAIPIIKPAKTSAKATSGRVLIVEDNADVRSYLEETLQGFGYDVIQAEDGLIGLEQAASHQPDLIISDVMMPRMDGFSFAKAIRTDVKSSHIPLILLTAKASDESRITGLETGVDDYLTKPFNAKELQVRIKNLIDQRKRLQQQFSTSLTIKPEEVSAVPMDQVFLQKITETIEANIGNGQFGVEMLSETAAMSVTHLNRKLNALIGQSAGKLIRSMRLQRAAELLEKKSGTVSEISYELGFSDPAAFARAFKRQFGVSPSNYVAS